MDGYTQITVGDKSIGLKFNVYAMELLSEIKGKPTASHNTTALIWAGVLGNAHAKQVEPEISFEEVNDWFDEILLSGGENQDIQKINEAFITSKVYKKLIEKKEEIVEKKEPKKKLISIVSAA